MHYCNPILKTISTQIKNILKEHWQLELQQDLTALLSPPPQKEMGDLCFPCFILSKTLKMSPNIVAKNLEKEFKKNKLIDSVNAKGPYLNINFNIQQLADLIVPKILGNEYFEILDNDVDKNKQKIMIEYSQPNTHKDLHVGHMRNLCFGNALVRMNKYIGKNIISATYPGDSGTHVAKCLYYLQKNLLDQFPETQKGQWLSAAYVASEKEFQSLSEEDQKNVKREYAIILTQIHDQSGQYYELWKITRQWSIDLMKETYSWADVDFDQWFFESGVDAQSVAYINQLYRDGKLIKNDGAIGIDLSEDKLKFCLLLKSDGTGLYSTKDIMLAKTKFEKFNITKNIYIVDDRQSFHFKQVFKTLEKLGFPHAQDCIHLPYAMVELPSGAMSSRKGKVILISELISEMCSTITNNYLEKYRNLWQDKEIEEAAKAIANSAIKYGMLRVDNNRKIIFDMKEWLKLDGETGPYLLYVVARINSIEQKQKIDESKIDYSLLQTLQEKDLLNHMIYFNDVINNGAIKLQTMHLCSYLYQLAKLFNSFYAECPILKASNTNLLNTRLAMTIATRKILSSGLECIGIKTIQRM